MISESVRAALQAIVGRDGLVLEADERRGYEVAARYGAGRAAAVVRPANTAEVSKVLSLCSAQGLVVVPQSGNTGLALGSTPDPTGDQVVVSLDRMRRLIDVSPENRSVTAEAGVRLSSINAALEPFGLWLPIDLSADPMVGGMVATNTGGARFLRYGDVRAHVLGQEVVLADVCGAVIDLGDGLRKDNSRLSLKDLFIGSFGALGVITRATLVAHPRPVQTAAALLVPHRAERILEILLYFEAHAGETLSAFEGISGGAMTCALALPHGRSPFAADPPDYAILVELSTSAPFERTCLDETLLTLLAPLIEGADPLLLDAIVAPSADLWRFRHALPEGLKAAGMVIGFDLAFRRDRVMAFRQAATQALAQQAPSVRVCDFGHVADGGVHFNVVAPRGLAVEAVDEIRRIVLDLAVGEYAGSFSGEHGLGRINQGAYARYVPAPERRLAATVARILSGDTLSAARAIISAEPGSSE